MRTPPSGPILAGFLVVVSILAGSVGYAVGSRDTRPDRSSVDVGFLYDMIAHHEQAQILSNIELSHGGEGQARVFAREILLFQSYEIGLMERRLSEWGYERSIRPPRAMGWMGEPVAVDAMPGLASEEELDLLSARRGAEADALFIALMRDHHRGGVHMADYAAEHADDEFVRDLAGVMARNQRAEIGELEAARSRAGLPDRPPGYVPADIPDAAAGHDDHG